MEIPKFQFIDGIEYIKIHGLQRTGTNYVAKLINDNIEKTETMVNVGGWKHGHYCAPWTLGREVHVLTIAKNPYAWLFSLFRYWKTGNTGPDLSNTSFDEFVRNKAVFEEAAGTPFLLRAANPVQHWNDMNFHWLSIHMNEKLSFVIPYESFLSNPKEVIVNICGALGLSLKEEKFVDCDKKCEPAGETTKLSKDQWEDKQYYVDERYMKQYTQDLLDFVNDELDISVMQTIGYRLVTNLAAILRH